MTLSSLVEPPPRLWTRSFTVYWLAGLQSVFGNALTAVVVAVLVYNLTGQASAMGFTLALGMLPALLSPFAGVVVDRVPVRPLLIAGDVLRGLLVLSLAVGLMTGQAGLFWLNSVVLLSGLITAFTSPATSTLLPQLVQPENLARANGLMGMGTQGAQLVGLLSGAALASLLGQSQTLVLDAATFLISAAALLLVQLPERVKAPVKEGFWSAFRAGLQVLKRHPGFAMIPVLAFVVNVAFAPMQMLLPEHLAGLGLPESFYGVALGTVMGGMLLGSLGVTALGQRFQPQLALPLGLLGGSASLAVMAQSASLPLFYLALATLGIGVALTNTAIAYLGQTLIPEEFRGRVFGLISATAQAGMPLAMIVLGPAADTYGSRPLWTGAAAVMFVSTCAWLYLSQAGRQAQQAPSGS
ncbi:MFS transporter [Deinococcus piscis]|uniref:MFS transporter n=1 Tax=Deinococcus piscis TaxID=394230 RepID=A0ABQ3K8B2_9DEIO|nr:MFS transporter [Deinococcus piscis]GHG06448.1 MFS transporter [Deinococcus piscis]